MGQKYLLIGKSPTVLANYIEKQQSTSWAPSEMESREDAEHVLDNLTA